MVEQDDQSQFVEYLKSMVGKDKSLFVSPPLDVCLKMPAIEIPGWNEEVEKGMDNDAQGHPLQNARGQTPKVVGLIEVRGVGEEAQERVEAVNAP